METNHQIPSTSIEILLKSSKEAKGVFTVVSSATGKDYTYKIKRTEFKGRLYTHVGVEMGYMNFKRIGTYMNGVVKNKKKSVSTESANAIAWIFRMVEQKRFTYLDEMVKIFHIGKCVKCNRVLTDAESIRLGIGPVCRGAH